MGIETDPSDEGNANLNEDLVDDNNENGDSLSNGKSHVGVGTVFLADREFIIAVDFSSQSFVSLLFLAEALQVTGVRDGLSLLLKSLVGGVVSKGKVDELILVRFVVGGTVDDGELLGDVNLELLSLEDNAEGGEQGEGDDDPDNNSLDLSLEGCEVSVLPDDV